MINLFRFLPLIQKHGNMLLLINYKLLANEKIELLFHRAPEAKVEIISEN